ncbi:signal peptidase II [Candidatus Laterigemmans baculatus]|uniref:signal peptidase II n=1 Tax=Candidatus Laterigemmans baculatus TaxID=2770505 RepID=UPI0013DA9E5A|nr:signal peptidase II [Candidatus Laterigemmans baculatus]
MPERSRTESSGHPVSASRVPANRIVVYCLIAVLGAAADLATKELAFRYRGLPSEKPVKWVIEGYLGIETAVNTGAVFGIGAGKGLLFATLSVMAGVGILVWLFWFGAARSWWLCTALAMVSAGILGNLYDRLGMWWYEGLPVPWKSGVRDWILMQAGDAYKWPNYNIADSLLVVGAIMLVWRSFLPEHQQSNSTAEADL